MNQNNIQWTEAKLKTLSRFDDPDAFRDQVMLSVPLLPTLVDEAVSRIQNSPFDLSKAYVGHSGGKDSVLVRWLTDKDDESIITVHTPKPEGVRNAVHSVTKDFIYGLPRPVLYVPERSTSSLKEFDLTVQIDGTRRAEANRRDGRDVGLIVDGIEKSRTEVPLYLENGLFGQSFIYPIYDWSDAEVWAAIWFYDIPYSAEYDE